MTTNSVAEEERLGADRVTAVEARWKLFLQHSESLRRFVRGFARGDADCEDVFQDLSLVVLRHRTGPTNGADFVAWCKGLARHILAHHSRSRLRRERLHSAAEAAAQAFSRRVVDPEQSAELHEALGRVLSRVDPEARRLLIEHHFLEESLDEIAVRHERTAAEVRMRLHRVRARARRSRSPVPGR